VFVAGALRRQGTEHAGREWIYGRHVIHAALAAGARRRAYRLVATAPALKAMAGTVPPAVPVDVVTAGELDRLTGGREHQGVALEVDAFRYATAEEVLRGDVVVVLDEVSDPRNVGAVARSALAAGADGLVLPKHRAASVTPAAVKASAGTIEHLPVAQVTNVVGLLQDAKKAGFWVYGAAGGSATSYLDLDLTGSIAIVLGSEGRGLRPLVARTCDALAAIPMAPCVESLNVGVAAALVLYEARRQRDLAAASCDGDSARPADSACSPVQGSPSAISRRTVPARPAARPRRRRGPPR
jgi:23S rRNA (guanosine2251-2'-O)-methyltransferase